MKISISQKNDTTKNRYSNHIKNFIKSDNPEPVEIQAYREYISNIILQLPNADTLKLLIGSDSTIASFYFLSNITGAINATLYNNLLNQRIVGKGSQYGVKQVETSQDAFTNNYLSVYTKLRYQLSVKDKALQQKLNADVASTVSILIPLWNTWITTAQPTDVYKLDELNTDIALIQMTDTLNTIWINPDYIHIIKADPSYPYLHINEFDIIYSNIPISVPKDMRDTMKEIFEKSGDAGKITSTVANATHTLAAIINNLQNPTPKNGALSLTENDLLIPGITFNPANPDTIINQLREQPPNKITNKNHVLKVSKGLLKIDFPRHKSIEITPMHLLSFTTKQGVSSSIFQKEYAGSSYEVKAIINNPVINPQTNTHPLPFDITTNKGWILTHPVKEAIKNGYPPANTITGYVFNSRPVFNFNEDGDFGYINSFVFSQFLELYITFKACHPEKIKTYFEENRNSKCQFLGTTINTMSAMNATYTHTCEVTEESKESLTVAIKPPPPGFIPPGVQDITESSCQLVAVEVTYPFA